MILQGQCRRCGYEAEVSFQACPQCGGPIGGSAPTGRRHPRFLSLPPLRFPFHYLWFVLLSAFDITLTWLIIDVLGGLELNVVAASVIDRMGLPGAILFKFSLTVLVIISCEVIGRRRVPVARRLAEWAVAITSIPVVVALWQIGAAAFHG
jgi:hypothetical protein